MNFYNDAYLFLPNCLSEDKMNELFMRKGTKEWVKARDEIITGNMRLVACITNRYFNIKDDAKDIFSVGMIGLIKAVDTYDLKSKKAKFSSYSGVCITNEINMFLRHYRKNYVVGHLSEIFVDEELELLKVPLELIAKDFVEIYEKREEKVRIVNSLNILDERDKKIMLLYFGFINNHRYKQHEIGKILNMSRPAVSKRITLSLKKMREYLVINYKDEYEKKLIKTSIIKNED